MRRIIEVIALRTWRIMHASSLAVFSMMLSIQFLSLGLLGEVSARIYFGSVGKEHYTVRELINFQSDGTSATQQRRAA